MRGKYNMPTHPQLRALREDAELAEVRSARTLENQQGIVLSMTRS